MQSLSYRPSGIKTLYEGVILDTVVARPLRHGLRAPIERDHAAVPAIRCLFYPCRPANVVRLIAAVIVDSIDAVFSRWTRANVAEERFKRIEPTGAQKYAPSAVVFEGTSSRIRAAFLNAAPDHIFTGPSVLPSLSMCHSAWMVSLVATARLRRAFSEVVCAHVAFCAASTLAAIEQCAGWLAAHLAGSRPVVDDGSERIKRSGARSSHAPDYTSTLEWTT